MHESIVRFLSDYGACDVATHWVIAFKGTPEEAWAACERADWMVWLLDRIKFDETLLRTIALDIAETVVPVFEAEFPDDDRLRRAVVLARKGGGRKAWELAVSAHTTAEGVGTTRAEDAANTVAEACYGLCPDAALGAYDLECVMQCAIEATERRFDIDYALRHKQANIVRYHAPWSTVKKGIPHE